MIYLICFLFSTLFCYYANKRYHKKKLFVFLSLISILIPTILAGIRANNIGTDINGYLLKAYKIALNSPNIIAYTKSITSIDIEIIYRLILYLIVKIFKNINVLLFLQHLFICSLFYIGSYKYRKKTNPTITFALFLLLYYNLSLNIMRQFCAISIIFYAYQYVKEQKLFKYAICVLIASMFHSTAIISITIYFIYKLTFMKLKKIVVLIILLLAIICFLNYNKILLLLNSLGIIQIKYVLRYSIKSLNDFDFNFADMLLKLYLMFLIFIEWNCIKQDKENLFYLVILIIDIIVSQIGNYVSYASRISLYFGIYNLINTSRIIKMSKKNKKIILPLTIIIYVVYFVYIYIVVGTCQTYPYSSIFMYKI